MSLGYFGGILDEGIEGKKPRNFGFVRARRGPVLGRRGARLVTGEVWPLT